MKIIMFGEKRGKEEKNLTAEGFVFYNF